MKFAENYFSTHTESTYTVFLFFFLIKKYKWNISSNFRCHFLLRQMRSVLILTFLKLDCIEYPSFPPIFLALSLTKSAYIRVAVNIWFVSIRSASSLSLRFWLSPNDCADQPFLRDTREFPRRLCYIYPSCVSYFDQNASHLMSR